MTELAWREIWRTEDGATMFDPFHNEISLQLKGVFMPIEVALPLSDLDDLSTVDQDELIRAFLVEWDATPELVNRTVEHWRHKIGAV